ncbi:histidine phosphatase family protein [Nocardioides sp. AE5]|uniref:histidine phosphatase family protein n=1 Tax=Nocardioides sp. AE5 TaxID=2962573 RepID=UPI002880E458|nr:histidine phosphatase family protein [Nocardioides sp. AE5]MDT0200401.1 histidine phosphatase family protein [Nocardioides sp. AE5]
MGQLLLVRHGQASWGTDDYDVLSPLGWEQSRLLGAALAAREVTPDFVVQGRMRRHRETAEAVVEGAGWQGIEVVEDEAWNEFDHLAMLAVQPWPRETSELTPAEFQEWFVAASQRWASGEHDDDYAESYAGFAHRVRAALERAAQRVAAGGTGLVVTSGGPIAVAAACLAAGCDDEPPPARMWNQLNRVAVNSSVTKVVVGRSGVATLVTFNEHGHLEGDGLTYR